MKRQGPLTQLVVNNTILASNLIEITRKRKSEIHFVLRKKLEVPAYSQHHKLEKAKSLENRLQQHQQPAAVDRNSSVSKPKLTP